MKPCLLIRAVCLLVCVTHVCALSSSAVGGAAGVVDLTASPPDDDDLGTATINQIENQIISFARMTEASNQSTARSDMAKFIAIFQNKIDGKMIPYLFNQTEMSKQNLEAKYQKVVECANTRDRGKLKEARTKAAENFETMSASHIKCRVLEGERAKKKNDADTDYKTKKTNRATECKIFDDLKKTDPVPTTQCETGHNRVGAEINYKYFKGLVEKYEELEKNCNTAKEEEKKALIEYNTQVQKYSQRKGECDFSQKNAMKAQCSLRQQIFKDEVEFVGCYEEALNAYDEASWRAKISMNKRKHEYRALLRIKCLLVGLASGDVSQLSSTLVYCRAQTYSGDEMVFPIEHAPLKKTPLTMLEAPCKTRTKEPREFWMGKYTDGNTHVWFNKGFLLSDPKCEDCGFPATPAPTPRPTPPPPPGKVTCSYMVKEELRLARYNGSQVKLVGTRMWPGWHAFSMSYETGQALELEARGVGSGDCDTQGTLALKCGASDSVGGWSSYQTKQGYVIVAGGSAAESYGIFKNPCYKKYTHGTESAIGAWYPDAATAYAKFIVGPDYDTTCWISADDILISVKYGGQLVNMRTRGNNDPELFLSQPYKAKTFKFNYVNGSVLEVVAQNIPTQTQSCASAGLGLVCKSPWPAWDKYDTSKGNVVVSSSSDGITFGTAGTPCTSTNTVTRWTKDTAYNDPETPTYIWTTDGSGPFAKFILKGNTAAA